MVLGLGMVVLKQMANKILDLELNIGLGYTITGYMNVRYAYGIINQPNENNIILNRNLSME